MSQTDRVQNHTVFAALGRLGEALDAIPRERLTSETLEDIERARRVLGYVSSVIKSADPFLTSIAVLNTTESSTQRAINEINAFASSGNIEHLTNASMHLDTMLSVTTQLPSLPPSDFAEGMRDALTSFRRSAGGLLGALEKDNAELRAKADELRSGLDQAIADLNSQKGRIDAAIGDYQQQFSQAEASRRDEFSKAMQDLSGKGDAILEQQRLKVQEAIGLSQTRLTDAQIELAKEIGELKRVSTEQANDVVANLETIRSQAQELLHVIGNTGMAGEFQKAASSSKRRAFLWQAMTVLSILGLIAFAIWTFYTTTLVEFSWPAAGTRAFVAVAFGILAAFASRQADRSQSAETHNRRYQLELSSIDPYLISLPVDMRHEVKIRLADKLFGAATVEPGKQDKQATSGTSLDIIKVALETIQELAKRKA